MTNQVAIIVALINHGRDWLGCVLERCVLDHNLGTPTDLNHRVGGGLALATPAGAANISCDRR